MRYVVLSFGGFLGLGDKYFALPWDALSYDNKLKSFILNVNPEKLKNAPGFDKDNWPNIYSREWEKIVFTYYDYEPYWK